MGNIPVHKIVFWKWGFTFWGIWYIIY